MCSEKELLEALRRHPHNPDEPNHTFYFALDSGKLSPRNSFVKQSGLVTFRFGELIPPGLKRGEIEARVHAAINALEPPSAPTPRADG